MSQQYIVTNNCLLPKHQKYFLMSIKLLPNSYKGVLYLKILRTSSINQKPYSIHSYI